MLISIYNIFTELIIQKIIFQLKSVTREDINIITILNLIKLKSILNVFIKEKKV